MTAQAGAGAVTLSVNGKTHTVDVDPDVALLYVLRNDLGLVGTMFGCGAGECGACFVLVDGTAVPSCDTPLWSAEGTEITTIEGLGGEGLSPLQAAFVTAQAGQCCYCVAGILMSAEALLRANPSPTEDDVRQALDRNLCRCGSQGRMVRAVLDAIGRI